MKGRRINDGKSPFGKAGSCPTICPLMKGRRINDGKDKKVAVAVAKKNPQ